MGIEQARAQENGSEHYNIQYGRKFLSLDINLQAGRASLRFGEGEWFRRHKPLETTVAFILADITIRRVANRENKKIILSFDTSNEKLKLWVKKRREILGLDKVEPDGENSYRKTVYKTYLPDT